MGKVPLVTNNKIGNSREYGGEKFSSPSSRGSLSDSSLHKQLAKHDEKHPNSNGDAETQAQEAKAANGAKQVTVYRATVGNQINNGDWVFLSQAYADSWARGTFNKKPKPGYKVVKATVPTSSVHWSGKNHEYMIQM